MRISLTFDVEPDLHTRQFKGITEGIPLISDILAKHRVKATFFTTCDCIENNSAVFRNLIKEGHEIALHGYRHERFDDLPKKGKERQLKKSISCFQKYLKIRPLGFRAPQHSIDNETLILLREYGFSYDSSYAPLNILQLIFFPKKFNLWTKQFFSSINSYQIIAGLDEFPTTSLFFPFVSLLFRAFPIKLQVAYVKLLNLFFDNAIFYAHSWDFINLPNSRIDNLFPHTKFIKRLDSFISLAQTKGFKFEKLAK